MKYSYIATITDKHGNVTTEKRCKTLASARSKFAMLSIDGAFPDRIVFDCNFNSHDEMTVYAEFKQPDFANYNCELGFIQREELPCT